MCLVDLDDQVFKVASNVGEKGAKWQIHEQLVHQWIIQLKNCQYNDSCRVFNHRLVVIEKLARDGQQGEVVRPRVHEELYCRLVDAQGQGLEEGDKGVNQLFIVKVELEAD